MVSGHSFRNEFSIPYIFTFGCFLYRSRGDLCDLPFLTIILLFLTTYVLRRFVKILNI